VNNIFFVLTLVKENRLSTRLTKCKIYGILIIEVLKKKSLFQQIKELKAKSKKVFALSFVFYSLYLAALTCIKNKNKKKAYPGNKKSFLRYTI